MNTEETAAPNASASPSVKTVSTATPKFDRPKPRRVKEEFYKNALRRQQLQAPQPLVQFLLQKITSLSAMDAEARKVQNRDIATFFQYFDGNEFGDFNEAGEWIADAQTGEEFQYSFPIVPAHVDSAKTMLLKTGIEYEYNPNTKDSVLDTQLAKMCEELAEEDITRIFTEDKRTYEILFLLLAGKSYRHIYWAKDPIDPQSAEIPVYSTENVAMPDLKVCGDCGKKLAPEDALCGSCMSENVTEQKGAKVFRNSVKNESVDLAENQMYVPNPLAVQHDLSKQNLNFTSFLIERDTIPRAEAEFLYCQVLPRGKGAISEELMIIRELERARLRTGIGTDDNAAALRSLMAGTSEDEEIVERKRFWLAPWRYANFLITEDGWYLDKAEGLIWCETEDEIPQGAEKISAGTFLGDVFPSGLFGCITDETLVEMSGEVQADKWIKLIFGARPGNTDGAGLRRIRPLADMSNDATNMEFKILMDDADPKTFINRAYLPYMARVGEYNLVDALKEGDTWDRIVHRLQGAAAHPNLAGMNEKVQAMAQFLTGTFSSLGAGAPDIKAAGTATGVAAMTEEAAGRYLEAILQIKIADINARYMVLKNRQKKSVTPQIKQIKERFGTELTKRFFTVNLRAVVKITAKKGTDQPKSKALDIAQMTAYGQIATQVAQHPQAVSILEEFADRMDMPLSVGIGLADREEARRRIGLLRENSKKFYEKQLPEGEVLITAIALVTKVIDLCESETNPESFEMPEESAEMQPMQLGDGGGGPVLPQNPNQPAPEAMPPSGEVIQGEPVLEDMPPAAMPPPVPQEAPPLVSSVVMMQEHEVFMDAYKDWILTEGARCDNRVLQASVQMMWKLHFEREQLKKLELVRREAAQMIEAEKMKMQFQASIAPPAPSPEEIAAQEKGAALESENAATEKEVLMETAKRVLDDEDKEKDEERAARAKDDDLERDILKQEHAHELEKEKSKWESKRDDYDDGREV